MNFTPRFAALIAATLASASVAFAQPMQTATVKTDRNEFSIVVPPGSQELKQVHLQFTQKSNISQVVAGELDVPTNATVVAASTIFAPRKKESIAAVAAQTKASSWNKIILTTEKVSSVVSAQPLSSDAALPLNSSFDASSRDVTCGCLTESEKQDFLSQVRMASPSFTMKQLCELIQNGTPVQTVCSTTPPGTTPVTPGGTSGGSGTPNTPVTEPDTDRLTFSGYIRKNTCSKASTLIQFTVNLESVPSALLEKGFVVKGRLTSPERKSRKEASFKPISDGKFAPLPLILLSSLGGSEKAYMTEYDKLGRRRVNKRIKIEDYLGYRSYYLARIPLRRSYAKVDGRPAVFEIANDQGGIYSVCFRRNRQRQQAYGYRNN